MISSVFNDTAIINAKKSVNCIISPTYLGIGGIEFEGTLTSEFKFGVDCDWIKAMEVGEPTGPVGAFMQLAKLDQGINIHNVGGDSSKKIFNGGKHTKITLPLRIYGPLAVAAVKTCVVSCLPQNELDGKTILKLFEYLGTLIKDTLAGKNPELGVALAAVAIEAFLNRGLGPIPPNLAGPLVTGVAEAAVTAATTALMARAVASSKPGQILWNIKIGDIVKCSTMCLDSANFIYSNQRTSKGVPLYIDFNLSFSTRYIPLAGSNLIKIG